MKIEIKSAGGEFVGDIATARIFLAALGTSEVHMFAHEPSVRVDTGADIALLILERHEATR